MTDDLNLVKQAIAIAMQVGKFDKSYPADWTAQLDAARAQLKSCSAIAEIRIETLRVVIEAINAALQYEARLIYPKSVTADRKSQLFSLRREIGRHIQAKTQAAASEAKPGSDCP